VIALDTNILVYAADRAHRPWHDPARELVLSVGRSGRGVLALQALTEFCSVATRRRGLDPDAVWDYVDGLAKIFPVHPALFEDLVRARPAMRRHGLSYWDALLWTTVKRAGATVLLTQDFQDGRSLEGVAILDPFRSENRSRLSKLLDG